MQNSAQIAAQGHAGAHAAGPNVPRRSKSQTREGRSEGSFNIEHGSNLGHPPRYQAGKNLSYVYVCRTNTALLVVVDETSTFFLQ